LLQNSGGGAGGKNILKANPQKNVLLRKRERKGKGEGKKGQGKTGCCRKIREEEKIQIRGENVEA